MRIFGFLKRKEFTGSTKNKIISRLQTAVDLAEELDIELFLENCPYTYVNPATITKTIVDSINSNYLKILWDPGNTVHSGVIPYPGEYNEIKDDIAHVHVKNLSQVGSDGSYEFQALSEGVINYPELFTALDDDRYSGILSLEPEFQLDGSKEMGVRRVLNELQQILAEM